MGIWAETAGTVAAQMSRRVKVGVARVYDHTDRADAHAVLVDRLWPRGVAKRDAPFQVWMKDVAPSTELRRWYGHAPERFDEFAKRYRQELRQGPSHEALGQLRQLATGETELVLVTATRDIDHSAAAVLRDVLTGR
jgi:uncharacterized protein YeaO (DUF488 family)